MKRILLGIAIIGSVFLCYQGMLIYSGFSNNVDRPGNITILDRHGEVVTKIAMPWGYGESYTGWLNIKLIQSIISIEDHRFYEHSGIDIIGKLWAIRENWNAWSSVRGGSTITEQYIKNQYFPNAERNIVQKVREGFYASLLELHDSKETILRKYLDTVYMGNGIYGIATANSYYNQNGTGSEKEHIIHLITRIHTPNIVDSNHSSAIQYAQKISKKLYGQEIIPHFWNGERRSSKNLFPQFTHRILAEKNAYCHGENNTLESFLRMIPTDICSTNNLTLQSTIDLRLMEFSRDTLEGTLGKFRTKNVRNGGIYIIHPETKKVLCYIGNHTDNSKDGAIDMIQKRRSVGSVLKPFVYKIAIEWWSDGESYLLDDTKVYATEQSNQDYIPENYIPKSYGPIRLKEALGNSLNTASVRLSESIGIGKIYESMKQNGLDLDHDSGYYGYGISIGTPELTLENVVQSYRNLLPVTNAPNFLLYMILSDEKNRARTFGMTSILNTSIPLAVKTGTSTDFRDNWVVGYHPDAIIGVWVGNADGTRMEDVSGVSGAGPIWHHIAEYMIAHGFIEHTLLVPPTGIIESYICLNTSCTRKEKTYLQENHNIQSRPLDSLYKKSDFIVPITEEEMRKWKIQ